MRKIYSLLLALFLLPTLALAQTNQAVSKTQRTASTTKTDSRLYVDPSILQPVVAGEADSYTLGAWFNLSSYLNQSGNPTPANNLVLLGYGGREHCNDNGCWNLCVNKSGNFTITGWGAKGAGGDVDNNTTVSTGAWHHAMVVYDADAPSLSIYLDGTLLATKAMTAKHEWFTNENPAIYFASYGFGGLFDEAQIYNRALTADEVTAASVNAQAVNGLVGLYTFDETPTTTGEFPNKSTQSGASTLPMIYEDVTGSEAWANGVVYVITQGSAVKANPTLAEGRELPATEVSVTIMPVAEGGTLSATDGETTYEAADEPYSILTGTKLTFTATPDAGYKLLNIYTFDGENMTPIEGNEYTIVADVVFGAAFTNESYTLTVENALNVPYTLTYNGEEVTDLTQIMGGGATYSLALNVPENIVVESVQLNGTAITAENGVYAIALDANSTLTINAREKAQYTVTINQPTGGTVTVAKGTTNINSGDKVLEGTVLTLGNTNETGYKFVSYVVNGNNTAESTYTVNGDVTISAVFEEGIDYCEPTPNAGRTGGTQTSRGDRSINQLVISDGTSSVTIVGGGSTTPRPVYIDHSETILNSEPGKTITITTTGTGTWMNTFIYIDKDLNGLDEGDLVFDNFDGTEHSYAGTYTFTLPANLTGGSYRVRYKVDWEDKNPCTYGQASDNGDAIIDFTIVIPKQTLAEARTVTVASENEAFGTVAITAPATEGNTVSTDEPTVTVNATPAEGYAFMNWTNAAGEVVSTSATYNYNGETDVELTAHFGHSLTFECGSEGTMSVTVDGTPVSSGNVYLPGVAVEVTVTIPTGKEMLMTINGGTVTPEAGVYSFTLETNADIQVQFVDRINHVYFNVIGNGTMEVWTDIDPDGSEGIPGGTQLFNGDIIPSGVTMLNVWFVPNEGEELQSVIISNNGIEKELILDDDYYIPFDTGTADEGDRLAHAYFYPTPSILGDFTITPTFSDSTQGIEEIGIDPANGPVEYFNLQGVRVAADNLVPGFYIIRQGTKTAKVLIRK